MKKIKDMKKHTLMGIVVWANMLAMPAILLGSRYFQEIAPEVAMDRAEIVSINKVIEISLGKFENCCATSQTK